MGYRCGHINRLVVILEIIQGMCHHIGRVNIARCTVYIAILAHIFRGVQHIAIDGLKPSLYGVSILYTLHLKVAYAHLCQWPVFVIAITGIIIPLQSVFAGISSGNAVVSIVFVTLVELIGQPAVIAEHIYLTTQQVIIIIDTLVALVHILQVRVIMYQGLYITHSIVAEVSRILVSIECRCIGCNLWVVYHCTDSFPEVGLFRQVGFCIQVVHLLIVFCINDFLTYAVAQESGPVTTNECRCKRVIYIGIGRFLYHFGLQCRLYLYNPGFFNTALAVVNSIGVQVAGSLYHILREEESACIIIIELGNATIRGLLPYQLVMGIVAVLRYLIMCRLHADIVRSTGTATQSVHLVGLCR
ncbi:hypothetical protein D3C72_501390 [compost metagenome]